MKTLKPGLIFWLGCAAPVSIAMAEVDVSYSVETVDIVEQQ
jgi:hypothetical protein